jgi:hypothetical protein
MVLIAWFRASRSHSAEASVIPKESSLCRTTCTYHTRNCLADQSVLVEMSEWDMKICCMGAGYVGGLSMAVMASQCDKVSCLQVAKPLFALQRHCLGSYPYSFILFLLQ